MVNQQCIVYKFECDLCDAGYVGLTRRHLHQRVEEHKNSSSSIGKHFRDKHSLSPKDHTRNFSVLKKCTNKFDCLVYDMFFTHELRPILNVTIWLHSWFCNKLFTSFFLCMFLLTVYTGKNFYTFYVHTYFFILLFYIHLIMTEARSKRRVLPLISSLVVLRNVYL